MLKISLIYTIEGLYSLYFVYICGIVVEISYMFIVVNILSRSIFGHSLDYAIKNIYVNLKHRLYQKENYFLGFMRFGEKKM